MPWIPAVVGAAGAIGGGLIGSANSAADRDQQLQLHREALQQWLNIHVPDPDQQKIILQRYVDTGDLDPALEQFFKEAPSQMEGISTDPRLKESQLRALGSLEELGYSGGMNLQDEANLQKVINETNTQDRGRREAIADNLARRGLGGSGLELAAQLNNTQAATNREAQAGLDTAASARQRALDAIMGSGRLAGSMQEQEFGQKAKVAEAQDAINRFNTQNMQSIANRNINRANEAQKYNLGESQRLSEANTDLSNKEQTYNKNLLQQNFENQAKRAAGATGQYGALANAYGSAADRTANQWAGIGSSLGKAGASLSGYMYGEQDPDKKKY